MSLVKKIYSETFSSIVNIYQNHNISLGQGWDDGSFRFLLCVISVGIMKLLQILCTIILILECIWPQFVAYLVPSLVFAPSDNFVSFKGYWQDLQDKSLNFLCMLILLI